MTLKENKGKSSNIGGGRQENVADDDDHNNDDIDQEVPVVHVVEENNNDVNASDSTLHHEHHANNDNNNRFHQESGSNNADAYRYNWRWYAPKNSDKNIFRKIRWFMVGGSNYTEPKTQEEMEDSLQGLARCLLLIRKYMSLYGLPDTKMKKDLASDQEFILKEVCRDLYAGGTPLWALEPVMQKAAEGLTGQRNVNWMIFPRKACIYNPETKSTSMFSIARGFNIRKLDAMEKVAVRLATFASNVQAVVSIPERLPNLRDFDEARQSVTGDYLQESIKEIQDLKRRASAANKDATTINEEDHKKQLATQILNLASGGKVACKGITSAGTCAFWFDGGWYDMIVAFGLAIIIALIGTSTIINKQERLIYEVVASAVVGLVSGIVALVFPNHTCYNAMSIAAVLDLMQGFGVIYSIIEIMSKFTVTGVADLFESVLFTELIAYFLRIGRLAAIRTMIILGKNSTFETTCPPGIDNLWYILFMPISGLAWSALFNPSSALDLAMMTAHAILGYSVNYGLAAAGLYTETVAFVSACTVSFSAGIHSRFTGKQAVGNTSAGMYALVPGAYVITIATTGSESKDGLESTGKDLFSAIIAQAIAIGIGGWTGTILCSPAVLGTTRGLLGQQNYDRLSRHASKRMQQLGLNRRNGDVDTTRGGGGVSSSSGRPSSRGGGVGNSDGPMLRF